MRKYSAVKKNQSQNDDGFIHFEPPEYKTGLQYAIRVVASFTDTIIFISTT
jgi:hypothetical protein